MKAPTVIIAAVTASPGSTRAIGRKTRASTRSKGATESTTCEMPGGAGRDGRPRCHTGAGRASLPPERTMTDATCQRTSEFLGDYVERRLGSADQAAMTEHFAACPGCRALLASYRALPDLVRRATGTPMPRRL